jgi:hypothetical protein
MSGTDITVVAKEKPTPSTLQSFIEPRPRFYLEHEPKEEIPLIRLPGPIMKFGRKAARNEEPILIYGPYRIFERDDMEPDVAILVPAPCWQIEIACAVSSEETWQDGFALAEHIAKTCKGVVWTGELGVSWPPNAKHVPRAEGRRIDLLKLEWVAHKSKESVKTGETFLQTLRRSLPEARPTRFGTYNPLQGQLGPKSDKPFLEFWRQCADQGFGHLSFRSRSPLVEGYVSFPKTSQFRAKTRSWAPPVRPTEEIVEITMEFDEKAISENGPLRERIVKLFVEMAKQLQCFYARGYVERKFSWYRNEPIDVPQVTELYPAALGYEWMGIPSEPAWLSWFGRPYMPLMGQSVKRLKPVVTKDGIFVRLGSKPADLHQLKGARIDLPDDLLVGRADHDSGDELMAKLRKAGMWSPPSFRPRRADVIPKIDG